jgi:hypothetical protein
MPYFEGKNVCICELAEVLSPHIKNRLGAQIENPGSATFAEGPQI